MVFGILILDQLINYTKKFSVSVITIIIIGFMKHCGTSYISKTPYLFWSNNIQLGIK